ncbi:MAG: alpha/beta hydrolase [bacterium]|nr:alpha/beta hydrolase [bacterium]
MGKIIVIVVIAIIVLLGAVFFIMCPPSKGELKQFTDENGNVLENSIAERCYLDIDGARIGLTILGKDKSNPVLLLCGGGPGIPQFLLEYMYPSALTDKFIVCNFDYRGTGISYEKVDPETINLDLFISDCVEVTNYLRERFGQDKLYLMGHSFGSYIALNLADRYPEYFIAYLAVSQVTDQRESECLAFDYMKEQYRLQGNTRMYKKMDQLNIRESEEDFNNYKNSMLRDASMHDLGVGTTRDMDSVITGIVLPSMKCKQYTIAQRINIWRGKIQTNKYSTGASKFQAFKKIKCLDIPIYFFAGEYDYTCCESLQRKYYEFIDAPEKEYYFYEGVAHSPIYEDYEKTSEILDEILEKHEQNIE